MRGSPRFPLGVGDQVALPGIAHLLSFLGFTTSIQLVFLSRLLYFYPAPVARGPFRPLLSTFPHKSLPPLVLSTKRRTFCPEASEPPPD